MKKKSLYLLGTKKEDKREWKLGKILSQFNLHCMKAATNECYTLDLTFSLTLLLPFSMSIYREILGIYLQLYFNKKEKYMMNSTFFFLIESSLYTSNWMVRAWKGKIPGNLWCKKQPTDFHLTAVTHCFLCFQGMWRIWLFGVFWKGDEGWN